jgi:TRAP-type C4-dicarboxylate transport system permease small subunit
LGKDKSGVSQVRWKRMKLGKLVNSGIPIICGAFLVIITALIFLQIILRNIFNTGLRWYDDVSQFFMSWLVLLSAIWLTKNNQHLNTGLKLHQKLNKRTICLIDGILELGIAIIALVVAYQGTIFTFAAMDIQAVSLPWLKMGYVYVMLPIAMLGVFYYSIKSFFRNLTLIFKKE